MYLGSLNEQAIQAHAARNRLQSLILLGSMGGFLGLLGWLLWGQGGFVILLALGAMAVFLNPSLSPAMVMRLYRARRLNPGQAPALYNALNLLSARAGLPAQPALYHLPSHMLNAFAVGHRGQSAIAISDGLLRNLGLDELVAVLAHEISHVRNNDLWVMGLADMFSRATSLLSVFGQVLLLLSLPAAMFSEISINWAAIALLVLAPNLAALAQLALSRTREYDADLGAAELTGDPRALISALAKIEQVQGGWLERVFLPGRRVPGPSLLRTHPDTGDRVERLRELIPARAWQPLSGMFGGMPSNLPARGARQQEPRWHISGLWH